MNKILLMSLMAVVLGAASAMMVARDNPKGDGPKGEAWQEPASRPHGPLSLTDAQEKEVLAYLKQRRTEEYERLIKIKDEAPRLYRGALIGAWRTMQLPADIQKYAETQQSARLKAWRLSRDLAKAADDQKAGIRKELMEVLGTEFDAEQQMREYRLGQLEEEIKRLRNQAKERAERRTKIIEENLTNLMENRGSAWPPPPPPPHSKPAE